jgi:hypothetical protein
MTNTRIFTVESLDGSVQEWIEIDRGNGEFTSMLKATYDAQQAAQVAPQA